MSIRPKAIFYQNGNDRKFSDQYTISLMTGEPMPKKWQAFFDMTPKEKARWNASLKLDEEYRIAEAQGFPNGIPGGRTRGDMLYYLTQQEEAHKRNAQEESFLGQSFIPRKTEMQTNNIIAPSNTQQYRQSNLLQTGTSIKKEPAFDVQQAIRKIASRLEARYNDNEARFKMSIPVQSRQDDSLMTETMPADMRGGLTQTFGKNGVDDGLFIERTYDDVVKLINQLSKSNGENLPTATSPSDIASDESDNMIGQYGDGGTVPLIVLTNENNIQKISEFLPSNLETAKKSLIDYAKSYGIDGIETIITILTPPQLKAGLAVVLFAKAVCEMAVSVKQKREDKIAEIRNLEGYTEAQKKQMIDDRMTACILEAVGEGLLDEMLDMVLDRVKLSGGKDIPEHIKLHVKTAWGEFIMSD